MKRNRPNPKRERGRRRLAQIHLTRREWIQIRGGKSGRGIVTPKRGKITKAHE